MAPALRATHYLHSRFANAIAVNLSVKSFTYLNPTTRRLHTGLTMALQHDRQVPGILGTLSLQ